MVNRVSGKCAREIQKWNADGNVTGTAAAKTATASVEGATWDVYLVG